MATKYIRDSEVRNGIEARKTPWLRQGPPQYTLSRGQRLFILFAGACFLVLLLQLATRLNKVGSLATQPVHRGIATVTAKSDTVQGEGPNGFNVTLETDVDGPYAGIAPWVIPEAYWNGLNPGDRVAVLYQLDSVNHVVHVVESGLVALPGQMR